jgi:catechol 2,3-dioxygenase-like lactoylglutathione lyase family enzyme
LGAAYDHIAPLGPQIGVTDVPRSHQFYCDVLGFTSNWEHFENDAMVVAEVQLGAGKLQIAAHDGVRDTDDQRRARRASIFFFQTDDVVALHAEIRARGGAASDLKVVDYWIRMRMFSMNDPDDHALWFGQQL